MSNPAPRRKTRVGTRQQGSETTAPSTESENGSEPLSEAFIAAPLRAGSKKGAGSRVRAPADASQLEVRRSSRVPSSSKDAGRGSSVAPVFIKAPPGVKPSVGYQYQVLETVTEEGGERFEEIPKAAEGSYGTAGGFRDTGTTQTSPTARKVSRRGRKRAATSAVPESLDRGRNPPCNPSNLASAQDFSPSHWEEPHSDDHGLLGPWDGAPAPGDQNVVETQDSAPSAAGGEEKQNSPMRITPATPVRERAVDANVHPESSPISQNPFLQRNRDHQSPQVLSPRTRQATASTRDPHVAWLMAQGLLPITDTFQTTGFVPSKLVGGVTYKVKSPKTRAAPVGTAQPSVVNAPHAIHTPSLGQALCDPIPNRASAPRAIHTPAQGQALHIPTNVRIYPTARRHYNHLRYSIANIKFPRPSMSQREQRPRIYPLHQMNICI
jgi:hypothetical protein